MSETVYEEIERINGDAAQMKQRLAELPERIAQVYKEEFLLKGRASEFDAADIKAVIDSVYRPQPWKPLW